jgi:hypothetical protein
MAINVTQDALWTASIDGVIAVEMRQSDGYCNATKMCAAGGKLFGSYRRNASTEQFLQALGSTIRIRIVDLVTQDAGGNGERHTWVHPHVAIDLAQWISIPFRLAVNQLVFNYYTSRAQPALPPPDVRVSNFVSSLAMLGIDMENPRYASVIRDYTINNILDSRTIEGPLQERWRGAVEIAEELGFKQAVDASVRTSLGRWLQKRIKANPECGIEGKKEKRLCHGRTCNIWVYKCCPAMEELIKEYQQIFEEGRAASRPVPTPDVESEFESASD